MTDNELKAFVLFRARIAEARHIGGTHPFLFDTMSYLEAVRISEALDGVVEANAQMLADLTDMRMWLWVNHGCPRVTLYGDDGEMQCHAAGCGLDFKRWPVRHILQRLFDARYGAPASRAADA